MRTPLISVEIYSISLTFKSNSIVSGAVHMNFTLLLQRSAGNVGFNLHLACEMIADENLGVRPSIF